METRRVYVLFYTLLQECQGVAMNGQDGRLDSESTYSWDSRFVFWQNVQRYSTLMPSFQIKYWGSVINLFKQKVQWIDEKKSWKLKAGALFLSAPYWKSVALKSPCKKKKVFTASSANSNSQGLAQAWATSGPPPPPAHPWFCKCRTRDGRTGRTFAKYFAGTVENFTGASLHRLYWVSVQYIYCRL